MFILGTSSAGPPGEYTARLDVEIDSARQGWNFKLLCTFSKINYPLTCWCEVSTRISHINKIKLYVTLSSSKETYEFCLISSALRYACFVFHFHILGPTISSVALKALEGVVRLHTPHKLQVSLCDMTLSVIKTWYKVGARKMETM